MDYLALKHVHVICAVLSYFSFLVRGVWMMRNSPLLANRWVRVAPHIIDTILLASAVAVAILIRQYPFTAPWLTAKLIGLIAYIGLGTVALKRGRTKTIRLGAWIAAQLVFLYIVAVALTKQPFPFG